MEVRSAAKPDAPVVDKLALTLVRVLPDSAPPDSANQQPFLHIAAPSGKTGFVPIEAMSNSAATRCATRRMEAVGKSPAISAALRNRVIETRITEMMRLGSTNSAWRARSFKSVTLGAHMV